MIRILLQFDDAYFVKAFSNYVSQNCPELEFICYTNMEKAEDYLQSSVRRIDAVIGEETFIARQEMPDTIKLRASERTVFSNQDAMQINIYQSGKAIVADIKSALALQRGYATSVEGKSIPNVVAVYSQQGGGGKTTVCYALALAAVRSGKQALYLNLEPVPYTKQLYLHDFKSSMDDLLFTLKDRRELGPVLLDTMERNEAGVLVMPPYHTAGDLLSLTREDVKNILNVLVENAGIEYLFIDLPCGLQPINLWVLEECTTILQVYGDDEYGRAKLAQTEADIYYQDLPMKGMPLKVLNKCRKKGMEVNIDAKIPFSESLQQGKMVREVEERNPAFLQSCTELLNKIH